MSLLSVLSEKKIKKIPSSLIFSDFNTISYNSNREKKKQRNIFSLSPSHKNLKNKNIYNKINELFIEGKFKKKIINGKKLLKKNSIFHILNNDKKTKKLPDLKLEFFQNSKTIIPKLIRQKDMNNYILRDFGNENFNFINNIQKKEVMNDNFYKIKNKKLENKIKQRLIKFENHKQNSVYDAKVLDYLFQKNRNLKKNVKRNDSKILFQNKKSRNIQNEFNYINSEKLYCSIKKKHENYLKSKIKEQGIFLSKNLTFLKNEEVKNIESSNDEIEMEINSDNIEKNEKIIKKSDSQKQKYKKPELFKNNLYHTIDLYKIIKIAKDLNSMGNDDDNDLNNDNIKLFKKERKEIEYKIAKLSKDKSCPDYLKIKLKNKTIEKFNGATGKYFGV